MRPRRWEIIMNKEPLTLGAAIDRIIEALEPLDENSRSTAISAVCAHLGMNSPSRPATPKKTSNVSAVSVASNPPATQNLASPTVVDIRTLKNQKQPASAPQMACVVAYYLQETAPDSDRKSTVTTPDLEKYFKQAGFKLPKAINQVLVDAKKSGYFDSAGRGEYRLNAVGYNLVAHTLPGNANA